MFDGHIKKGIVGNLIRSLNANNGPATQQQRDTQRLRDSEPPAQPVQSETSRAAPVHTGKPAPDLPLSRGPVQKPAPSVQTERHGSHSPRTTSSHRINPFVRRSSMASDSTPRLSHISIHPHGSNLSIKSPIPQRIVSTSALESHPYMVLDTSRDLYAPDSRSGFGRRRTQHFASPAGRRTSRPYEHIGPTRSRSSTRSGGYSSEITQRRLSRPWIKLACGHFEPIATVPVPDTGEAAYVHETDEGRHVLVGPDRQIARPEQTLPLLCEMCRRDQDQEPGVDHGSLDQGSLPDELVQLASTIPLSDQVTSPKASDSRKYPSNSDSNSISRTAPASEAADTVIVRDHGFDRNRQHPRYHAPVDYVEDTRPWNHLGNSSTLESGRMLDETDCASDGHPWNESTIDDNADLNQFRDFSSDNVGITVVADAFQLIDAIVAEHTGAIRSAICDLQGSTLRLQEIRRLSRGLARLSEKSGPPDPLEEPLNETVSSSPRPSIHDPPALMRKHTRSVPDLLHLIDSAAGDFGLKLKRHREKASRRSSELGSATTDRQRRPSSHHGQSDISRTSSKGQPADLERTKALNALSSPLRGNPRTPSLGRPSRSSSILPSPDSIAAYRSQTPDDTSGHDTSLPTLHTPKLELPGLYPESPPSAYSSPMYSPTLPPPQHMALRPVNRSVSHRQSNGDLDASISTLQSALPAPLYTYTHPLSPNSSSEALKRHRSMSSAEFVRPHDKSGALTAGMALPPSPSSPRSSKDTYKTPARRQSFVNHDHEDRTERNPQSSEDHPQTLKSPTPSRHSVPSHQRLKVNGILDHQPEALIARAKLRHVPVPQG